MLFITTGNLHYSLLVSFVLLVERYRDVFPGIEFNIKRVDTLAMPEDLRKQYTKEIEMLRIDVVNLKENQGD